MLGDAGRRRSESLQTFQQFLRERPAPRSATWSEGLSIPHAIRTRVEARSARSRIVLGNPVSEWHRRRCGVERGARDQATPLALPHKERHGIVSERRKALMHVTIHSTPNGTPKDMPKSDAHGNVYKWSILQRFSRRAVSSGR